MDTFFIDDFMETSSIKNIIPKNIWGMRNHSKVIIETQDTESAAALFELAKLRMLAVNYWHDMAGVMGAVFQLTDGNGQQLYTSAVVGNFIRIDVPKDITLEEEGYEWVKIESIRYEKNTNIELMLLQVRPTFDPALKNEGISHFYENAITTNFIIERNDNKVMAYEQVRKGTMARTINFFDKIRNVIVLNNEKICLPDLNWKALFGAWVYHL